MKIIIKETSAIETLSIIDPKSGVDYIADFIGNTGALTNGEFDFHEDDAIYSCDQNTFEWWSKVVTENQALQNRISDLSEIHGQESVYSVIHEAGSVDLEDYASNTNQALDEVFGERK